MTKLGMYLKHQGKTQVFFATKIGTTPTHLGRLLTGKCCPTIRLAYEIEKETGGLVTLYDWIPIAMKENISEKSCEK